MKKNKGIVYKVTHKESGKIYVGITTKSIEERKKDHSQKAKRGTGHFFQEAIATYGPCEFIWEQVDTASSIEELARKEREYVQKHDSYRNGYNSDSGGGLQKQVYQYNMKDGSLVATYNSLENAANAVGAEKRSISRACFNVNNAFRGFYWSYTKTVQFSPSGDKRRKKVRQLDSDGNLLAEYNSVAEASRQTGISKSPIAKSCRGEQKTTGGYFWNYVNIEDEPKVEGNGNK